MIDLQARALLRDDDARITSGDTGGFVWATREELHAAIHAAVAPLATREELHAAIHAAIAPLATRAEMYAAIKEEGERSRQHTDVLIEDVRDDNRLILEHLIALSARVDALAQR